PSPTGGPGQGWCWAGKLTCERLSGRWSDHPKCAKSGSRGGTDSPVDRGGGATHRNSGRLLPGGQGRAVTVRYQEPFQLRPCGGRVGVEDPGHTQAFGGMDVVFQVVDEHTLLGAQTQALTSVQIDAFLGLAHAHLTGDDVRVEGGSAKLPTIGVASRMR